MEVNVEPTASLDDRISWFVQLSMDGDRIAKAPSSVRKDRELVLRAAKTFGGVLHFAHPGLLRDSEVVLTALESGQKTETICPEDYSHIAEELRFDLDFMATAAAIDANILVYSDCIVDRRVALGAVQQNGLCLEFLADRFKGDREIVLAAVKQDGRAIEHAASELCKDREVALTAVRQNAEGIEALDSELLMDPEIVSEAVKTDQEALEYAGGDLLGNLDFILQLIVQGGATSAVLKYCDEGVRNDRKIVTEVVRRDGMALGYASPSYQTDREILDVALTNRGCALKFVPIFNTARDVVIRAVTTTGCCLPAVDVSFLDDDEVGEIAVSNDGSAVRYLSSRLRSNRNIIKTAVENCGDALQYASEDLKNDRTIVGIATRQSALALKHASDALRNEKSLVLDAVGRDGLVLQFASGDMCADVDVVSTAVKSNPLALQFAATVLRSNGMIVDSMLTSRGGEGLDGLRYVDEDYLASFAKRYLELFPDEDVFSENFKVINARIFWYPQTDENAIEGAGFRTTLEGEGKCSD